MGKRSDGVRRVFRHCARAHHCFHSNLKKPVGNALGSFSDNWAEEAFSIPLYAGFFFCGLNML
jgi:hypothetical protein